MKKMMPPTYFMILLVLSIIFHFIYPLKKIIFFPYNQIGWILIIFGVILNIWADGIFKKIRTTIKHYETPSKFVDYGPFKISRHPVYLGMFLILLGVFVICGSIITIVFPIIFLLIIEKVFIPLEERNMIKKFGKKYLDYKRKIRRWI